MIRDLIETRGKWLLIALTALVYARGLTGGFVWDDHTFFVENDILPGLRPWDISTIVRQPISYWGENLPFSELLFVLEFTLFGRFTPAYHAVSLVLYLVIGSLAWTFVGNVHHRLLPGKARGGGPGHRVRVFFVVALFLLHPVHVEVVSYITGQQHLLSVLFSLLAVNLFWRVWADGGLRFTGRMFLAVACYYLAVLAKYQAVATGLFIPLLWLVLRRRENAGRMKPLAIWGLINIPVVLWVRFSTGDYGGFGQTDLPIVDAMLRGVRILGAHLLLVLKPYPLNFGYPFDDAWSADINFLAGLLVLLATATVLVLARRSVPAVGLLVFTVYMFPVLQIFVLALNATIYDRYLFLPLLGLSLVAERSLNAVVSRRKAWKSAYAILAGTLVLAVAVLTVTYIPKFHSDLASLEHAYRHFPGWKRAAFDYEVALIEAGRLEEAESLIDTETTFAHPEWVRGYFRGWIELERGNVFPAIDHLEGAARIIYRGGYFPFTGVPLGRALVLAGEEDRAEIYLRDVTRSPFNQPIEQYRAARLLAEIEAGRTAGGGRDN